MLKSLRYNFQRLTMYSVGGIKRQKIKIIKILVSSNKLPHEHRTRLSLRGKKDNDKPVHL